MFVKIVPLSWKLPHKVRSSKTTYFWILERPMHFLDSDAPRAKQGSILLEFPHRGRAPGSQKTSEGFYNLLEFKGAKCWNSSVCKVLTNFIQIKEIVGNTYMKKFLKVTKYYTWNYLKSFRKGDYLKTIFGWILSNKNITLRWL